MEHEEAPGVASLVKGQASFPAWWNREVLGVTMAMALGGHGWFECAYKLLLNLDIYELESCWIWIAGVPILGRTLHAMFEITNCDLEFGALRSQICGVKDSTLASTSKLL